MKEETSEIARHKREVEHFTALYSESGHTWWGNVTKAGQRRNDRRIELLCEMLQITPETRILEVGCGRGEYTKRLAKLGCPVTALDITPLLIQEARRHVPEEHVSFRVMDATDPDWPEASFDIVFGKSILHHINYYSALKAYKRLLKPGGHIFFSEPNLLNPLNFLGLKIPLFRKIMEFSNDEIAFTRRHLLKVLVNIGYQKVKVKHFDFLFPVVPDSVIDHVDRLGRGIEKIPGLRAFSGSLLIVASRGDS